MQFKHVTLDFDGSLAILKLDHQEVMNAISIDMLAGLGEALDAIDDKRAEVPLPSPRAPDRAFCTRRQSAGPGRNNQKPDEATPARRWKTAFHPFLRRCAICSARS
jgi:2-(1,2-epoxy-1,2-dihydrophenyl)acetyl-CoA isomerase